MKKLGLITLICVAGVGLSACSQGNKASSTSSPKVTAVSDAVANHQDMRMAFNDIKMGDRNNKFAGGSSLEQLKALFGEPTQSFKTPAGDVTLDGYTWQFDGVSITANLLHDSTITRSISNFAFIRYNTITKKKVAQIQDKMTFRQATDLLGQPDVLAESVSSSRTKLQAVWVSGIEGATDKSDSRIELTFINDQLTEKSITGVN